MKYVFLLIFLFFFSTLNSKSYSSDEKFNYISNKIVETISLNCKPKTKNILSFPDSFKNLTSLSNCDLAFSLNPQKYAGVAFDYLRAQQWHGINVLNEKLDYVNQYYLPEIEFKLHNETITKKRMLKGDKGAFLHFINQNYKKLSKDEMNKFSKFEDFMILQVLYLEQKELTNLINNYNKLDKYLDEYIKVIYRTSSFYRDEIKLRLLEIAKKNFLNTGKPQTWEVFVQDMPYVIAKKFRIIFSFSDPKYINNDFLWALRIRTFSQKEKFSIYQLGYKKLFYKEYPDNADTIYYSFLTNLNKIIFGNKNGDSRLISLDLIEGIHELEKEHPKLREDYIHLFPKIKETNILDIDINKVTLKFKKLYQNKKLDFSNLNKLEKKLLISDIKNIYLYPYQKDLKYLEKYDYLKLLHKNKGSLQIIRDIRDPLEKLIFFIQYERGQEPNESLNLIKNFKKNFNNVCLNKNFEMCDKSWKDVNLMDLKSDIFIQSKLNEFPKNCKITNKFKFFYTQLARNIGLDLKGYYSCSIENVKQILNLNKNELFEKLPNYLTTIGWNNGYSLANNEGLLSKGGGFLAEGLLENRSDKRRLQIAHETFNFLETTNDQKAFSYVSNISKQKLPLFDKKEITGDLPYYTLSKIYTTFGKFERAFNANYVDLNQPATYSTNYINSRFLAYARLAMAKHNLRNMNIPEILIDEFTNPYLKKINQLEDRNIKNNSSSIIDKNLMISVLKSYINSENIPINSFEKKEDYFKFVGNVVGKNSVKKDLFCSIPKNRKLLFNLLKDPNGNKHISKATSGIEMFLFYEFVEVYFKCLNVELNSMKDADIYTTINFSKINYVLKNDFNRVLKLGFNYVDPRNIFSILFISNLAKRTNNINLNLMAITALEYMYQNLTHAFIKQNSLSLRLYQKYIEEIIVNTSVFYKNFDPQNDNDKRIKTIVKFKLNILTSSAKRVLLTNYTRLRYLGFNGRLLKNEQKLRSLSKESPVLKYNYDNFIKLTKYYQSLDKNLAKSNNLVDYVNTKSKYSEHGSEFVINPFIDFKSSVKNKDQKIKFDIYSLLYSKGYLKIFNPKAKEPEQSIIIKIDDKKIGQIKNKIANNKFLDKKDVKELCDIFKNVHSRIGLSKSSLLMVVPSVNLIPIPSEIILGDYCQLKKSKVSILHLGDLSAASDFLEFYKNHSYPNYLVGIGNPTIKKNNKDEKSSINLLSKIFRGLSLNKYNNDDFIPLPEAEKEITEISNLFENKHILLNEKASILNGLKLAENLNKDHKAIVIATHGFPLNLSKDVSFPSLLSIENKKRTFLNSTQISQFKLNNSIIVLSACDTASGLLENSDLMFTGFVQSFANSGSNIIVSSLWPVETNASQKYTTTFFKSWKDKSLIEALKDSKNSVKDYLSLPFITIHP